MRCREDIPNHAAGDKKINQETKCKQYFNSLHSATACNHVLKWKLHLGQVHGYFMDYFCHWLYITHVVWHPLHDVVAVNESRMEISWCLSAICIFECELGLLFLRVCKCMCCVDPECHLGKKKLAPLIPFAWLAVIANRQDICTDRGKWPAGWIFWTPKETDWLTDHFYSCKLVFTKAGLLIACLFFFNQDVTSIFLNLSSIYCHAEKTTLITHARNQP